MSALSCSPLLGALMVMMMMIMWNHHRVYAFTEEENFVFIDKILDLLNNNNECRIPTYEEVDELQASFDELEALYGDSLASKLNNDQKLVRETLLDQWESFQKRMAAGVVIRTAKRRAFLCKVEQYQEAKYGSSICTSIKDNPGPISDHIFERNPIVRYLKHLETNDVPEFDPNGQPNGAGAGAEKRAEVIHTPINENSEDGSSDPGEPDGVEDKADDRKPENFDHRDDYDPLADIPVPLVIPEPELDPAQVVSRPEEVPAVAQPGEPSEVVSNTSESKVEPDAQQDSGHKAETDSKSEPSGHLETKEESDSEHKAGTELETKSDSGSETSDRPNPEQDVKKRPIHGAETGTEHKPEVEPEPVPESQPDQKIAPETLNPIPEDPPHDNPNEPETKLVDDETDFADLSRLNDHDDGSSEWDVDLRFGSLVWPDEQQTDNEDTFDDSIKRAWREFLNEQEIEDEEEKDRPSPPVQNQLPTSSYSRPSGKLRNRKKEFMRSVARDAELRKAKVEFGWIDYPKQGEEYRSSRWTNLADNNFCQLSVNRNYLSDSRGVKAIKSFGQNAKRRLMC